MAYEVFTRKVVRSVVPTITINSFGRISLNKAASSLLQDKGIEVVLLLWDKEQRKVALQQADKTDGRAYRVAFHPRSKAAAFSAKTFFEHIKYDNSQTRSFVAKWNPDGKMFEIELTTSKLQTTELPRRKPGRPRKIDASLL